MSATPLNYTGERFVPEAANALAHYDHAIRYEFVRRNFSGAQAVVDLGCGIGVGTRALAPSFGTITGVDPSEEAISEARSRTTAANATFEVLGDFASRENRSFDLAICLE